MLFLILFLSYFSSSLFFDQIYFLIFSILSSTVCVPSILLNIPSHSFFFFLLLFSLLSSFVFSFQSIMYRSLSEYQDDLELRTSFSTSNTTSTSTSACLPRKYRCGGRVGRGGRIMMDRFPVWFYSIDSSMRLSYFLLLYPSLPWSFILTLSFQLSLTLSVTLLLSNYFTHSLSLAHSFLHLFFADTFAFSYSSVL